MKWAETCKHIKGKKEAEDNQEYGHVSLKHFLEHSNTLHITFRVWNCTLHKQWMMPINNNAVSGLARHSIPAEKGTESIWWPAGWDICWSDGSCITLDKLVLLTTFSSMMMQKLMHTAVPVVATWELFLIKAHLKAAKVLTVTTR